MSDYRFFVLKDEKSVGLQRHQDELEQEPIPGPALYNVGSMGL